LDDLKVQSQPTVSTDFLEGYKETEIGPLPQMMVAFGYNARFGGNKGTGDAYDGTKWG
jgi:hypothetical protein